MYRSLWFVLGGWDRERGALGIEGEVQNASAVAAAQHLQFGPADDVPYHDQGVCPAGDQKVFGLCFRCYDAFHEIGVSPREPPRGHACR